MSKTATVYMSANVSGDSVSESIGPLSQVMTNSPAQHFFQNIQNGNTTIQVPQIPSPPSYVLLIPPSNSANSKWLMSSGDTVGYQIQTTLPTLVSVGPISSFVIRGAGAETIEIWFF